MLKEKLEKLFSLYLAGFKKYDIEAVSECYHLPCTLHTHDRVVLLSEPAEFNREFDNIFAQLKLANTQNIVATRASYVNLTESLVLVCVDWDFINNQQEIFADFSAFYHVVVENDQASIVNVVSQDLSSSKTLAYPLTIKD